VGHCRAGAFPLADPLLHQGLQRGRHRLRHHQYLPLHSDANSFANLSKWIDNVREVRGEEALIMIIGNKSDLDGERCVEQALASSKIGELGLTYMEVSAKTGQNIKEFFRELAFVIAGGGKKNKEETPAPKPSGNNNPVTNQPARPANNNTMKLSSEDQKTDKKKKKCEC
jgi:GTPase SAR1 family protein